MSTVNDLHLFCNDPALCKGDISVKVTFPIGTPYRDIAIWIESAPSRVELFEDREQPDKD